MRRRSPSSKMRLVSLAAFFAIIIGFVIEVSGRSTSPWLLVKPSSFLSKAKRAEKKFYKYNPIITTIPNAQFLVRGGSGGNNNNNLPFDGAAARGGSTMPTSLASGATAEERETIINKNYGDNVNDDDIGSVLSSSSEIEKHSPSLPTKPLPSLPNEVTENTIDTAAGEELTDADADATSSGSVIHATEYVYQAPVGGHIANSTTFEGDNDHVEKSPPTPTIPTPTPTIDKKTKKILKEQKKEIKKKDKEIKKLHKQIAKNLKNRNATNKRRKVMHFAWGIFFATLNNIMPHRAFLKWMSITTGFALFVELMRYREGWDWMNKGLGMVFGKALRKSEMDGKFMGSMYYFAGVTATSYLYPKPCATLGIIQLAIADPTASYFGRATRHVYWSRINSGFCWGLGRNKGILGFLGGAVSCVPMNYRILRIATSKLKTVAPIGNPTVFLASLALGLAGAFADLIVPTPALTLPKELFNGRIKNLPPFHVDDNFIVPLLSGFACTYVLRMAGIPEDVPLKRYLIV